jgi:hypothetical protein
MRSDTPHFEAEGFYHNFGFLFISHLGAGFWKVSAEIGGKTWILTICRFGNQLQGCLAV